MRLALLRIPEPMKRLVCRTRTSVATRLPIGFAGEAFESHSKLAYHRARWMDPSGGRFVSTDRHSGNDLVPITLHKYLYAGLGPANWTDPSGLDFDLGSISAGIVGIGILATMATADSPLRPGVLPKGCRVDVRATHINGSLDSMPVWHLFVICAQESGDESVYRGGPESHSQNGFGAIVGTTMRYKEGSVDWDPSAPSTMVLSGPQACAAGNCFASELGRIAERRVPYDPLGPNSNTVASTLLNQCGIPREKPVTVAIGWGDPDL